MPILLDDEDFLEYRPGFLGADGAKEYFVRLRHDLAWQEESIVMFGRKVPVPRLVCWYGDPQAVYTYSGVRHEPLPWPPALTELREAIQNACGEQFNSVLANLYRNERDSMGWHADKEPELGSAPYIASLSLGETRLFQLQHNKTKRRIDLELESGSLLLMGRELQRHWRHAVPKSRQAKGERINLTFRYVFPRSI